MPAAIAIFDHNIVLQLNSLVGRFPRFDTPTHVPARSAIDRLAFGYTSVTRTTRPIFDPSLRVNCLAHFFGRRNDQESTSKIHQGQ